MLKPSIVKITGAKNPASWYAGLIGQVFTVESGSFIDDDKIEKYTVTAPVGQDPLFLISVEDCKPVI